MGNGGDVIDELMTDHGEVEEMFARIQAMTGQGQQLRDKEIEGHSRVEKILKHSCEAQ
ncbi:hypothetical protein [Kitasatospora sp. GP82]|uniref:hypothetical protein n=1 Tax=Kitasatospora sp. GP82 TaxID=3035089 RepID=UPI0024755946|nr:hypothetical protein [Kitasatospora sp. GP82]MDH6129038.1 membrane protein involved in colicin uptake [Kitasatospora sp. GP82]